MNLKLALIMQAFFTLLYINHDKMTDSVFEKYLPLFHWQERHEMHLHHDAVNSNLKREFLDHYSPHKISVSEWNELLRKIENMRNKLYVTKIRNNKGQPLNAKGLTTLLLYTNFDESQRQLKRVYREKWIEDYSKVSHFARHLNNVLKEYGKPLNNTIVYHGTNQYMHLKIHPTFQFWGPFSTTTSLDAAKNFAQSNGFVIKMQEKFPRLGDNYAIDVSEISCFPEEKEMLVGFMRTRIMKIYFGNTVYLNPKFDKERQAFVLGLIKNNIYSYSERIEKYLQYFIDGTAEKEFLDEYQNIKKTRKIVKIDTLSDAFIEIFMNASKSHVDINKIIDFYPAMETLHLFESYDLTNDFIKHLKSIKSFGALKMIKFHKYTFSGPVSQMMWKEDEEKLPVSWNVKQSTPASGHILQLTF